MVNEGQALQNSDITLIQRCSPATACRRMKLLRAVYAKRHNQTITVGEYCRYEGITINDFRLGISVTV